MARLTLHSVYGRFRADMFLSSLTESSVFSSINGITFFRLILVSHCHTHGDGKQGEAKPFSAFYGRG